MTFWGRLSVWLQPFWGCLSFWNTSSWPLCLCGIPDHDLPRSFVCAGYQLMTFWGHLSVRDIGLRPFLRSSVLVEYPDYDLLRSFVCAEYRITTFSRSSVLVEYQLMTFWGRLSVRDIGLRSFCPFGIPAYDLLRSFVCAEYRITTFLRSFVCVEYRITTFLRSSVLVEYQLMTFWGHLSVRVTSLWPFEVVCPCRIPAYDLLRSSVLVEYQHMTFWGRLSVRGIPAYDLLRSFVCGLQPFWGRLSLWNNSLWPSEVVCLCGISDYDLFKVVCLCGISDYDLFKVVCPCGIPAYDLLRSFVCGLQPFWGRLITAYDLLRSFVCAEYRIMTFLRSFGNTSSWLWGRLSVRNIGFMTFWGRLSVWYTALMTFEVICFCGITGLWPF